MLEFNEGNEKFVYMGEGVDGAAVSGQEDKWLKELFTGVVDVGVNKAGMLNDGVDERSKGVGDGCLTTTFA